MARYASIWTPTDMEAIRLIAEQRRQSAFRISDRALARAIDVSPPRVRDLFNYEHGAPSLREFIALCQVFNLSPSSTLEQALKSSKQWK